ncbi:MAG: hypothetical protein ABL868_03220 [Sulfuriferula sp.]
MEPKIKIPMTVAERQRASRAKRRMATFESFSPIQISVLLSAEASQALRMLSYGDKSQKKVIEDLLIEAYRLKKL